MEFFGEKTDLVKWNHNFLLSQSRKCFHLWPGPLVSRCVNLDLQIPKEISLFFYLTAFKTMLPFFSFRKSEPLLQMLKGTIIATLLNFLLCPQGQYVIIKIYAVLYTRFNKTCQDYCHTILKTRERWTSCKKFFRIVASLSFSCVIICKVKKKSLSISFTVFRDAPLKVLNEIK